MGSYSSSSGPFQRAKLNERARQPRFATFISLTFTAMVGSLIVLAGQTDVPQITRAPGTIVPTGDYPAIETLSGGIVAAVHVLDGQTVEAGDVLVELRHPDLSDEQEVLDGQLKANRGELANVKAVLDALNTGAVVAATQIDLLKENGFDGAAAALDLYRESQRIQSLSIAQQEETLSILGEALRFANERVSRKAANLERIKSLYKQGLKPLNDVLEEEDSFDSLRAAASEAQVRLAEAQTALRLAISARSEETLTLREEMLTQRSELENEQSQLVVAHDNLSRKLAGLRLVAPAGGVVQSVAYPNPGEVIEPGETLYELLPTREALVVEARIPNSDVGHVNTDHSVAISVDTFDVRRFGKVEGRLQSISPMPLVDDRTGETYFRASVVLSDAMVGEGHFRRPLQAGMTVVAEMTTGEQSLLAYMLKPVQLTMERAFNER
ncbi:Hemolysin secretion protein D, chromosomal [Tritonibacter multivorans]|uniref:Membrane fusion protein (MFP) family protein n=1 Tax=Tritonibacter multivorans TaxID=928856 RepID=A0A0P1GB40_9RHOB|nr:HlyD family type I secretion periplasmic adaptor subunit [Tritonibacter multivorans]MDA7422042.1 HlyD family type I secretion periplasmic adaptor subunit [Tritonibacter multivorans]CUH78584.1 Hemolysin secretion protein D, chromosomal [Tritonibacter multivorans]SFD18811.1 membrane fusion protein, adhesin transport system [Tritonibacter multivorans]